jgi:hypothetical protein
VFFFSILSSSDSFRDWFIWLFPCK